MSKKNETKSLPSYRIWSVQKAEGSETSNWVEIGSAWKNEDGKGFNLYFKAMPLPGTQLVLREPLPPRAK